jgi:hypothetical protein
MQLLDCRTLNETFNIVGDDYILIEEKEYNQSIPLTNITKQTNISIENKPNILKVYNADRSLYAQPIHESFCSDNIIEDIISKMEREQSIIMHNANIEYSMLNYIPVEPKKQKQKIQKVTKNDTKDYYDILKKPQLNISNIFNLIV